jgi:hypothetical protein
MGAKQSARTVGRQVGAAGNVAVSVGGPPGVQLPPEFQLELEDPVQIAAIVEPTGTCAAAGVSHRWAAIVRERERLEFLAGCG